MNFLLPFTNPSTPLYQDLLHTIILCGTLYYAPQFADYCYDQLPPPPPIDENIAHNAAADTPTDELPIDNDFILDPNMVGEVQPPPMAPTPPLDHGHNPPAEAAWLPDDEPDGAGPADDRPRPTHANRTIGAKKAKSIARRDQRRAYYEFHREQAEMRRREEAEGKEERDAALAAEKARRAVVEREIAERERLERERKKEEERKDQEEERERRERTIARVKQKIDQERAVDLVDLAWEEGKDRVWIEKLVRASGILTQLEKVDDRMMITESGWLVRINMEIMEKAYASAAALGDETDGRVSFHDFGRLLENTLRAKLPTAAY